MSQNTLSIKVSIDEAMTLFQGRQSIKQYMKDKPPNGEEKHLSCAMLGMVVYHMQVRWRREG